MQESIRLEMSFAKHLLSGVSDVDENRQHYLIMLRFDADPRPGTCYKRVSRNGTCSDRLRENVTEEQCCVDMIGKFSVAWKSERGSTCQPCPRRSGNTYKMCVRMVCCSFTISIEHYNCADEVARITRKNAVQVNKFYVRVPESYVPGTALAYLSVTGDCQIGILVILLL